jgi:hypothetical protein
MDVENQMNQRMSDSIRQFCLAALLSGAGGQKELVGAEAHQATGRKLKYEWPASMTGAIYASGTNHLLFTFKRSATRSGSILKARRDFTYPDSKPAARERVVYDGDELVAYELEELQIGAAGSATIRRAPDNPAKGTIEFSYTSEPGGRPKVHTESLRDNTLTADMIGPFLRSRWEGLSRGEKVKCRYLVLPRRETVGFTFVKASDSTWHGREVLIVRMEPTSLFVSALVDPLVFTIEKAPPHRVLQYVGRTTPKIRVRGEWKDLDAVTVFDWDSAR